LSLKDELIELIARRGPLGVNEYMALCLHHPEHGYYASRPAIGAEGDFITAPVISQMFGELIGVWAAESWRLLGSPERVLLVEIGPGDGTLMADALRAAAVAPGFLEAADLWLVEPSAPLRDLQRRRLSTGRSIRWAVSLDQVPGDAPVLLIGNEVLDCMPARQFQRTEEGWAERVVLSAGDGLGFGLRPARVSGAPDAPVGAILEYSERQAIFARSIALRLAKQAGYALLIDYGRDRQELGDTLQALRRHAKVDPLERPGECDLTMWADFDLVRGSALTAGAAVAGPTSQAAFLERLGIELRADRLMRLRPDRADRIHRELRRLIAPDQMGALFKAITLHTPGLPTPPGFQETDL
jgi:NADH dehydrogenase [ubiquinone] 1 alpha subcomplex assembly factor 7